MAKRYSFTDEARAERLDFLRRQGGGASETALAAQKRVDAIARMAADEADTNTINLGIYELAERKWAEGQYDAMVQAIRTGAARFQHPGVSLDAEGNIVITAEAIRDMAERDKRNA